MPINVFDLHITVSCPGRVPWCDNPTYHVRELFRAPIATVVVAIFNFLVVSQRASFTGFGAVTVAWFFFPFFVRFLPSCSSLPLRWVCGLGWGDRFRGKRYTLYLPAQRLVGWLVGSIRVSVGPGPVRVCQARCSLKGYVLRLALLPNGGAWCE